jgi:negative regulator of flagellin synthesis FlgM
MEISRQIKPGFSVQGEAPVPVQSERPNPAAAAPTAKPATGEPRLEQLQDALRSLPEIDLGKVAAIKQALQRGEIHSDSAALASSMLSYHSGSDA